MEDLRARRLRDEIDLAVLEALVINPRAPWSKVGEVLGISPSTAVRRWEYMRENRIAWMTCSPGAFHGAQVTYLEILLKCMPEHLDTVARRLVEQPGLISVLWVSGAYDFEITVYCAGADGLVDLLRNPVWSTTGILEKQVSIGTKTYSEGLHWRVGALTRQQQEALQWPVSSMKAAWHESGELHRSIVAELQLDPRVKALRIAERNNVSVATVSRHIDHLIAHKWVSLRTEISADVVDWPVAIYFYHSVPAEQLQAFGSFVAQLSSTRLSMSVINARWNLISAHWLHSFPQIHQIESIYAQKFPGVSLIQRSVRLRELKRIGWVLDAEQHPERNIPVPMP